MQDILMSVGGSIIYPKTGINTSFLKEFNDLIRKQIAENKNRRFFIIAGGGFISNQYKDAALKLKKNVPNEDLDWLGVRSTRLNAHLLRTIFHDIAAPAIIEHYENLHFAKSQVYICAAEYPGATTDWFLVVLAQKLELKQAFSLLNVDMIYDKDPHIHRNAKPIKEMHWRDYRRLIGDEWLSNRQLPFDPLASRLAQQIQLNVNFLSGHNLKNFSKAIVNKSFVGSVIHGRLKKEEYE